MVTKIITPYQSREDVVRLISACTMAMSVDGDVAEFGVYEGGTVDVIVEIISPYKEKQLHLFDTFQDRFPDNKISEPDMFGVSNYPIPHPVDFNKLMNKILKRPNAVSLHIGLFSQYINIFNTPLCFAHIDSDLYLSTKDAISIINKCVVLNGVVCFHDCGNEWAGVNKAIKESLSQDFVCLYTESLPESSQRVYRRNKI